MYRILIWFLNHKLWQVWSRLSSEQTLRSEEASLFCAHALRVYGRRMGGQRMGEGVKEREGVHKTGERMRDMQIKEMEGEGVGSATQK